MFLRPVRNVPKIHMGFILCVILLFWQLTASASSPTITPQAINAIPQTLISADVFSYDIVDAKVFWHSNAYCPVVPAETPSAVNAPEDPVLIRRIPVFGGTERTLFEKNDPRQIDVCNPYEILSNVVSDGDFVYFTDSNGLQKLSVEANVGDDPTLMSSQIVSTANENKVELAVGSDAVYALTYSGAASSKVWRINKQTNATRSLSIAAFADNLSFDGTYLYWMQSDVLRTNQMTDTITSLPITVATNVTGYFAEGYRVTCGSIACLFSRNVYYGQGKEVNVWNRYSNTYFGPVYVSNAPEAGTFVYDMVTDKNNLYLFESRPFYPPPENFLNHKQTLVRTTRSTSSTNGDSLYENISVFYINTDDIQLNGTRIYWREDDQLKQLPTDAEALSPVNMTIDRIEVTQGIQDINNNVFLVEGRTTYVRVMANTDSGIATGVTAVLHRLDPNTEVETAGPILPVNKDGKYQTITAFPTDYTTEGDFIFRLPEAWLNGNPFKLKVTINPHNFPTETNIGDNAIVTKTFDPVPSPRLEIDFYVFSYTKNGEYREPRLIEDVVQTFSWMRRVYPLASTPGNWGDPSPGLRPHRHHVHLNELGALVDRMHPSCAELPPDRISVCASTYLNAWLRNNRELQKTNRIFFGLMAENELWNRGSGGNGVASGPAGSGDFGWDFDGSYADWYSGHEIAHALGRDHPAQGNWCEHSADDLAFPYAGAWIGKFGVDYGFDVGDPYFDIERQLLLPGVWTDFMGYCNNQWTSDYTYAGLWSGMMVIDQTRPAGATGPTLSLYGFIVPDTETAVVQTALYQPNGTPHAPDNSAGYAIQLFDAGNNKLSEFPFLPIEGSEDEVLEFAVSLPFNSNAASYRVVTVPGEVTLGSGPISSNAPQVSNVQVVNPVEPLNGNIDISWTASDADGDPLLFDLFASVDGGPFEPVVIGIDGLETAVNTEYIPGGNIIFRVIASDGIFTGAADSPSYTMQAKPPEALILSPGDGNEFQWGQPILFAADVYDLQDGMVSGSGALTWYANGQAFGSGNMVEIDDLPVGELQIDFVAKNSLDLSTTHSITITIHDDVNVPDMQLAVEPAMLSWNSDESNPTPLTTTLTIYNEGMGTMTWTATNSESWLTLSDASGTTQDEIVATADISALNLKNGDIVEDTIVISSNSTGQTQTIEIPVHITVGSWWIDGWTSRNNKFIYLPTVLRQ